MQQSSSSQNLSAKSIRENLENLFTPSPVGAQSFIFDLCRSYGISETSLSTHLSTAKFPKTWDEFFLRYKLYFKAVRQMRDHQGLQSTMQKMIQEERTQKHRIRFVMVTNFQMVLVTDLRAGETKRFLYKRFPQHYEFFLPLAGYEKESVSEEYALDRKVAHKLSKFYEQILKDNPHLKQEGADSASKQHLHQFLCRIIFCFFAEDAGLFPPHSFTENLLSHTKKDGSDLEDYLDKIFERLNLKEYSSHLPLSLKNFPYVNGSLFAQKISIPKLTRRSREYMADFGKIHWDSINPDIFGAILQAVEADPHRLEHGMHYTSPHNIEKLIGVLFLESIQKELLEADTDAKLQALHQRLQNLQIFDPACGSGNFLIVTFKKIRRIEIEIFSRFSSAQSREDFKTQIRLSQFYGIEIEHFPSEMAKLSLHLAQHQMNQEFAETLDIPMQYALPQEEGAHIHCGNALLLSWNDICTVCVNSANNRSQRERERDLHYRQSSIQRMPYLIFSTSCRYAAYQKQISRT